MIKFLKRIWAYFFVSSPKSKPLPRDYLKYDRYFDYDLAYLEAKQLWYVVERVKIGMNTLLHAICKGCGEWHYIKTISGPGTRIGENYSENYSPQVNGIYVRACICCGRKSLDK